ncbi:MAG: gluconate 2-dehydrogenase subunit 3 family protein, partial [Chitinophagales bacterium]|nr:gluconate 2-dehydrogenase subunit 3 family protein [Chitinophagales bacterium]
NTSFKQEEIPPYYFTMMKQLTLWGYFTSEIGMTQALKYVPVPGRFDGCIDYKKGDKIMVGLMG